MRKFLVLVALMLLAACSAQSYLEESKQAVQIPFTVSYDTTAEGIQLSWSANWDSTAFQILRGTNESDLAEYITNAYQTNWVDTEALPGQDYFYSVKAFTESGRQVGYTSVLKGYRSYQDHAVMHAPTEFKADIDKYGDRITLYWFGQKESRFRIYRSAAALGTYEKIAEAGGLKYTDTNVRPGERWYYKISSVGKDFTILNASSIADTLKERFYNDADTNGAPDFAGAAYQIGSTANSPVGVEASGVDSPTARSGAIQVSWKWDTKADYYKIYRSSSEEGEYQLIAPYSRSFTDVGGQTTGVYSDKGMPSTSGSLTEGVYTYPVYYYKVSAIKNNQESALSVFAAGSAVDTKDILPAPENLTASLVRAPVAGFDPAKSFPTLNGEGGYTLEVSWDSLPADISDTYGFNIIASNTVTAEVSTVNGLLLPSNAKSYPIPNPAFNDEIRYTIVALNTSKGNLPGISSTYLYKSATPPPPVFVSASKLKRIETTNEISTNASTDTQYKTGFGGIYTYRGTGFVTKVWTTEAQVGDVELVLTPPSAQMQQSYNIYRRKKTAGNSAVWEIVSNVAHSNDIDKPEAAVNQVIQDVSFTPEQYQGSGTAGSIAAFYPVYEYRAASINGGRESAPSVLTKEGQAINPADILPSPSYLSVPFHWASGTGLAFWSGGWTVTKNSAPYTTGYDQIVGKSGTAGETQRIFITWAPITTGSSYDYRFRHAAVGNDPTKPEGWYTHGGMGTATWIKLNNETTSASMTSLYGILDSVSYVPEAASFAVSATNKSAGGLDGNTIGITFDEAPSSPY